MQTAKEKKKIKRIEKPKTDIEAMPNEVLGDPKPEEELLLPSHLSLYSFSGAMPTGAMVDPFPTEKPVYNTPSGDIPPVL